MSINDTVKSTKFMKNEENAVAFKLQQDKALYNISSSFIFRNGSYLSKNKRISNLESCIEDNIKAGDKEFVMALAWFLGSVQGIRLSPTLILSYLVYNKIVDGEKDYSKINKIVKDVFTRPDFISNSLAYYKLSTGSRSIGSIPTFFKKILRNKFSEYLPITLKKRKMKSRDIKLSDLIKVLKPFPKTQELSTLYKSIIENTNFSSLQVIVDNDNNVVKADSAVAVLSNTTISDEKKVSFVVDNIDKLAINELIRNLSVIPSCNYDKIYDRLQSVFKSQKDSRFINPFDLVLLNKTEYSMGGDDSLRLILDAILYENFLNSVNFNVKNPIILMDVSGSMDFVDEKSKSINMAVKYMSFILPMILKSDIASIKYYNFGTSLHDVTNKVIGDITTYNFSKSPNKIAEYLIDYYEGIINGGTRLRDCTIDALKQNPECDGLFIFSDEVSWADENYVNGFKNILPSTLHDKTFVFNVDPTRTTMFSKTDSVTRISGLDGKVIYLLNALLDFPTFKKNIINMFNSSI